MKTLRKALATDTKAIQEFLSTQEELCLSLSSHYREMNPEKDMLWIEGDDTITSLLLFSKAMLFPYGMQAVTAEQHKISRKLLHRNKIHSIQGLPATVDSLLDLQTSAKRKKTELIDYALMGLDTEPTEASLRAGPAGLRIGRATDLYAAPLLPLQEAYEKEEVLPKGGVFNLSLCQLGLMKMLNKRIVMIAEMDGEIVAKANTNAEGFTRSQIGGVYVSPAWRGQGIARRLVASLALELRKEGRAASLFVKKTNMPACTAYTRIGFTKRSDYCIAYLDL